MNLYSLMELFLLFENLYFFTCYGGKKVKKLLKIQEIVSSAITFQKTSSYRDIWYTCVNLTFLERLSKFLKKPILPPTHCVPKRMEKWPKRTYLLHVTSDIYSLKHNHNYHNHDNWHTEIVSECLRAFLIF